MRSDNSSVNPLKALAMVVKGLVLELFSATISLLALPRLRVVNQRPKIITVAVTDKNKTRICLFSGGNNCNFLKILKNIILKTKFFLGTYFLGARISADWRIPRAPPRPARPAPHNKKKKEKKNTATHPQIHTPS